MGPTHRGLGPRIFATDAARAPHGSLARSRSRVLQETADRPDDHVEQLLPQDRLQPALLDRLTDDEPDKKQEPREARVLSKSRMRQSVLRDLAWLFNATRLDTVTDLTRVPNVRRSVLNFGMPALSGRTASSLDVTDLARAVREAILTFEPRILPETLQIRTLLESGDLDHHNVIGVEILGELWAQPVPLEFLVRTEFDLETGKVQIADLGLPRGA
jgi:type VI secretion system protein ImpF